MSRSVRQAHPTNVTKDQHLPGCNQYHTPGQQCTRIEWTGNLQVHIPIKENQK